MWLFLLTIGLFSLGMIPLESMIPSHELVKAYLWLADRKVRPKWETRQFVSIHCTANTSSSGRRHRTQSNQIIFLTNTCCIPFNKLMTSHNTQVAYSLNVLYKPCYHFKRPTCKFLLLLQPVEGNSNANPYFASIPITCFPLLNLAC